MTLNACPQQNKPNAAVGRQWKTAKVIFPSFLLLTIKSPRTSKQGLLLPVASKSLKTVQLILFLLLKLKCIALQNSACVNHSPVPGFFLQSKPLGPLGPINALPSHWGIAEPQPCKTWGERCKDGPCSRQRRPLKMEYWAYKTSFLPWTLATLERWTTKRPASLYSNVLSLPSPPPCPTNQVMAIAI